VNRLFCKFDELSCIEADFDDTLAASKRHKCLCNSGILDNFSVLAMLSIYKRMDVLGVPTGRNTL
jgi:hypothetical protein